RTCVVTLTMVISSHSDINGPPLHTLHLPCNGNATYITSTPAHHPSDFTPTTGTITGLYTWHASYSGDGNNNEAIDQGGVAEQVTLTAASPTNITLANPSGTVHLTTTAPPFTDSPILSGPFHPSATLPST